MESAETTKPASERSPLALVAPAGVKSNASKKPKDADYSKEIWDAAHSDYRCGATYGKISETYGIPIPLLVARKQREAWHRDLRQHVQAETLAALAVGIGESRSSNSTDEEIVAAAAQQGATAVQRHRGALAAHIEALGEVAKAVKRVVDAVQKGEEPRIEDLMLLPKGSVAASGYILQQVGNALARTVPLERRAYGLDDGNAELPFEDALRAWHARKAAERSAAGG